MCIRSADRVFILLREKPVTSHNSCFLCKYLLVDEVWHNIKYSSKSGPSGIKAPPETVIAHSNLSYRSMHLPTSIAHLFAFELTTRMTLASEILSLFILSLAERKALLNQL